MVSPRPLRRSSPSGGPFGRIDRDRASVTKVRDAFAQAVAAFLEEQRPKIVKQLGKLIEKTAKSDDDRVDEILKALDFDAWSSLSVDAEKILVTVLLDGASAALSQIGTDETPALTEQLNEAALEFAKNRAAELVGMKRNEDGVLEINPNAKWAITDGTRELLRSDVEAAIDEGLSTADLGQRIEDGYAFSSDRADLISRTEVARADIQGSLAGYSAAGVEKKESVLGSEHDDDDECDEAAAMGEVPIDDDFGGLGDPPYHPRCVCDVLPVLAGEDESD